MLRSGRRLAALAVAHVDKSAHVHPTAQLAPGAVVLAGAYVGPRCKLLTGSVVGPGVSVGEGTVVGVHTSLLNCRIGAHCMLHSGISIGADGFGFTVNDDGSVVKKPQLLRVLIGDNVEIGSGSCIDRGSWRDTQIGNETKLDNLVQVGHNVLIGRGCLLCAHSAVGGSAELGNYCVMGGKSAVADHVRVCAGVRLAAFGGITKDIGVPGDYAGFPAQPAASWRREVARTRRLCALHQPQGRTGGEASHVPPEARTDT